MSHTGTDPSVVYINQSVIGSKVSQEEAVGKTYQSVSQSMSLAVQDASDMLRNFSTVNLAALSYAQEQLVATENLVTWGPVIEQLQTMLQQQLSSFTSLGQDAGQVLQEFMAISPTTASQAPASSPRAEPAEEETAPSASSQEAPGDPASTPSEPVQSL